MDSLTYNETLHTSFYSIELLVPIYLPGRVLRNMIKQMEEKQYIEPRPSAHTH
jgi:hypothetical protein